MDVLRWTTSRFEERGLPTPRLDADILVGHALGVPRVQLYVQFDRPLLAPELASIRELVKRRQGGESVAYAIGKKEFFGLEFEVDARVLVPRPDTETLVDEAMERLGRAPAADHSGPTSHPATPADSVGALAASPSPSPRRPRRLRDRTCRRRAGRGARQRRAPRVAVTFLEGDLDAPLAPHAPFDLIVANLPYIPTGELGGLPPEVRAEPARALDGGADGLALVRRLVAAAPALLAPGGALALEIGAGQAQETARLCAAAGLVDVRVRRDLGAVERVVSAVRS